MDARRIDLRLPNQDLLNWFDTHRRPMPWRLDSDPYRIWVSEVMLQQTQVDTVIPYYERFMLRFPSLKHLADSELDELLRLWQGLGYYQRARNLHRAARVLVSQHNGEIPRELGAFLKLPGVGEYIAAAVLSIAFNSALAVLDGNVIRVASRYWGIDELPVNSRQKQFFRQRLLLEMPRERCGDFNQAMMELGALVCRSRGWSCGVCPLSENCFAREQACVADFPGARVRRKRPRYVVALAVICDDEKRILIQKRKEEGHLGGLWEFPGGKAREGETPLQALVRECQEELGCDFMSDVALKPFLHVYSHFEIEIHAFTGGIFPNTPKPLIGQPLYWMNPAERYRFAFPAANQRIFNELEKAAFFPSFDCCGSRG